MDDADDDGLGALSRADLCTLGRELMLAGHLQDRAGIPTVLAQRSMDDAWQLAIDEWMTASPIYTRRMQRLLGFDGGDDVPTIFKGLQLDVGFAHQFMDVGYEIADERHGEFWLRHCGALHDVIPMGEPFVKGMCHDVEDPTFDATAVATNARAQVRPLHRPPGVPRGGPDCHWTVAIDDAHPAVLPHPDLAAMAASVLAAVPNDPGPDGAGEVGGWSGYDGPFEPGFELEHLSHRALRIVCREFAVQTHLLARAMMTAVDRRFGPEEADEVGRAMFTGMAWVHAERVKAALGIEATDPDAFVQVLPRTYHLLLGDYVGVRVERQADGTTLLTLAPDAGGLTEGDHYSLPGLLAAGADEIIESLVHGVDDRADVAVVEQADAGRAWRVTPGANEPAPSPGAVDLVRISGGAAVTLRRRIPVRSR
jgi:hypothetical protein